MKKFIKKILRDTIDKFTTSDEKIFIFKIKQNYKKI